MLLVGEKIEKKYDECILDKISIEVNEGEIIGITGPSGCGKSTLLSILGLMQHPTTGEILYNGMDVKSLSDKQISSISRIWIHIPGNKTDQFFYCVGECAAAVSACTYGRKGKKGQGIIKKV